LPPDPSNCTLTNMDTTPKNPLELLHASPDLVEQVWVRYWAPILASGGISALKGELYDSFFLVNEARQVYRHATGGLCDDLTASAEGIIAMDEARVERLTQALRDRIGELEAQLRVLKAREGG